ncbi:hypothetical protein ACJX0J_023725, partial [Zea mays]
MAKLHARRWLEGVSSSILFYILVLKLTNMETKLEFLLVNARTWKCMAKL